MEAILVMNIAGAPDLNQATSSHGPSHFGSQPLPTARDTREAGHSHFQTATGLVFLRACPRPPPPPAAEVSSHRPSCLPHGLLFGVFFVSSRASSGPGLGAAGGVLLGARLGRVWDAVWDVFWDTLRWTLIRQVRPRRGGLLEHNTMPRNVIVFQTGTLWGSGDCVVFQDNASGACPGQRGARRAEAS